MATIAKGCAVCTLPASIFCQACACSKDERDGIDNHWYCSNFCQETDKFKHKQYCDNKAAQKLFNQATRAGEIAQAIFYAFLEHTWAYDLGEIKIVKNGNDDLIRIETIAGPGVAEGPPGDSVCRRYASGWLIKFPSFAFRPVDRPAKYALLASQHSIWSLMVMRVVVQFLFKDLVTDVKHDILEVVHYIHKDVKGLVLHKDHLGRARATRDELPYCDNDATGALKGIYQITLRNGTKFALDLAGAQYNRTHETVVPWLTYIKRSLFKIKYCVTFGTHYKKHADLFADYKCITHLTVVMEQLVILNDLIKNSEYVVGFTFKDALGETTSTFHDFKRNLILEACKRFQQHTEAIDNGDHEDFDIRHPRFVAKNNEDAKEIFLTSCKHMEDFDWNNIRSGFEGPNDLEDFEKENLKRLFQHRCVYKLPGDWRLVFLKHSLPSSAIPANCVSVNPFWKEHK